MDPRYIERHAQGVQPQIFRASDALGWPEKIEDDFPNPMVRLKFEVADRLPRKIDHPATSQDHHSRLGTKSDPEPGTLSNWKPSMFNSSFGVKTSTSLWLFSKSGQHCCLVRNVEEIPQFCRWNPNVHKLIPRCFDWCLLLPRAKLVHPKSLNTGASWFQVPPFGNQALHPRTQQGGCSRRAVQAAAVRKSLETMAPGHFLGNSGFPMLFLCC